MTQLNTDRATTVGCSDLGALLGLCQYRSPVDLWLEKTGQRTAFEGNAITRRGHRFEPSVAEEFCDETGRFLVPPSIEDEFRIEKLRADRIEAHMAYDMKVVSSDLGYFFDQAVA